MMLDMSAVGSAFLLAVRFAVMLSGLSGHGALHALVGLCAAALGTILALAILAALTVSALAGVLCAALLIFAAGHVFSAAGAGARRALSIGATGVFTTRLALLATFRRRPLGVHGTLFVCRFPGRSRRSLRPQRRGRSQRNDQHERRK